MFGAPKEVQETLAAIDAARKQNRHIGVGNIWNDARRLTQVKADTIDAIRNHGWTPEQLSWQIIANVAWEYLVSGRFHTYRGVVGVKGMGLKSVFGDAMRNLVAFGKMTEEEATAEINRLTTEIQRVG